MKHDNIVPLRQSTHRKNLVTNTATTTSGEVIDFLSDPAVSARKGAMRWAANGILKRLEKLGEPVADPAQPIYNKGSMRPTTREEYLNQWVPHMEFMIYLHGKGLEGEPLSEDEILELLATRMEYMDYRYRSELEGEPPSEDEILEQLIGMLGYMGWATPEMESSLKDKNITVLLALKRLHDCRTALEKESPSFQDISLEALAEACAAEIESFSEDEE